MRHEPTFDPAPDGPHFDLAMIVTLAAALWVPIAVLAAVIV